MGIKITNAERAPAIEYNLVHLNALRIIQETYTDDSLYPKYRVEVEYRLYGVLQGVRFYEVGEVKRVIIPDFIPVAQAEAMAGDPTLYFALRGIESAVATILSQEAGLITSVT